MAPASFMERGELTELTKKIQCGQWAGPQEALWKKRNESGILWNGGINRINRKNSVCAVGPPTGSSPPKTRPIRELTEQAGNFPLHPANFGSNSFLKGSGESEHENDNNMQAKQNKGQNKGQL